MTAEIFSLIPKVMADIGSVAKTRKNEQQKYTFRGIEDMYLAAHPAMVAHGVFCAPEVTERTEYRFDKMNDYGKVTTWIHVAVKVIHRFYAPDGSCVSVTTWGEGLDNSDKATNKAMSGAMKYALIELFCVPTADIEDSDRTTPEAGITHRLAEPITLAPTLKNTVEGNVIEKAVEPESEYISNKQKGYLAKRFRESLRLEMEPRAEELRHVALASLSKSGIFKSKFIDDSGNPTSDLILASEYDGVGKALVTAAKTV